MKKNNNKGFMLIELLATATLVCTVLIFLYTQFYNVRKSYNNSFKYNTVNSLYALYNIRSYLIDSDTDVIESILELNPGYVDLIENKTGIYDVDYWNELLLSLNVEKIFFTKENLNDLISQIDTISDEEFKKFIKYIDYNHSGTSYRLIAKYSDGTFASILIGGEDNEE